MRWSNNKKKNKKECEKINKSLLLKNRARDEEHTKITEKQERKIMKNSLMKNL